ncbi:MAG TPA: aspartate-semialdehyde dehydrogenase [Spirochaetota bacterium]|nr:aspartate-semialdehyde dehydrogenase [Spirochaetota bacterium]HOM38170.1 aspartate-semialdehyde dehydrogenase [Spirochaetota bacterium]HPQ48612.1 aspartate-semialdehyde dehydrogenase [Spirochaetota bacterium]
MAKNVAIVGATGAVGQEMIKVLEKRNFPVKNIKLLASKRSAGKDLLFKGEKVKVEELTTTSFKGVDIALFSAGGAVSKDFAKHVIDAGAVMIDNSSAFRLEEGVPLVVPEVNPEDVKWHKGIISNPNCSTIIMVVAINPIYKLSRIKRIVASTYQAVSGAGASAMQECIDQTRDFLNGKEIKPVNFAHQIAFNLIPHIDTFQENLYTREEMKMVWETRKIMHDDQIKVAATTVRVPVLRSHSESLMIETEKKLSLEQIKEAILKAPGVILEDEPQNKVYPMPFFRAGKDEVSVGRIRYDLSSETGIMLWVVGDQLLKGAALNAVQIAELL